MANVKSEVDIASCSLRDPLPQKPRKAQVQPLCSEWNTEPGTEYVI